MKAKSQKIDGGQLTFPLIQSFITASIPGLHKPSSMGMFAGYYLYSYSNHKIDDTDSLYQQHGNYQFFGPQSPAGKCEWRQDDDGCLGKVQRPNFRRDNLGLVSLPSFSWPPFFRLHSALCGPCRLLAAASQHPH